MPYLLLTRPRASAQGFLDRVGITALRPVMAPLLKIAPTRTPRPAGEFAGVILTSAHAARADVLPLHLPAHVVGTRTADAVRALGGRVVTCEQDAAHLFERLTQTHPRTPLLHLRGSHVASGLAEDLVAAGLPCAEWMVYEQKSCPLTQEARDILAQDVRVIAPVFSPRSATLLSLALQQTPPRADVRFVALSAAVAEKLEGWGPAPRIAICARPTGEEMVQAVRLAAEEVQLLESRRSLP